MPDAMKSLLLLTLATLLAACSTTEPTPPAPAPSAKAPVAPPPPPAPVAQSAPVPPPETPQQVFERARAGLAGQSVYFAFDSHAVTPEQASTVARHANLANATPREHIALEGNCDERGGREYNLALGQRRADAVKSRLVELGVARERIETVSFGKEKPRAACHDESCWSQNRRVDFVETWK